VARQAGSIISSVSRRYFYRRNGRCGGGFYLFTKLRPNALFIPVASTEGAALELFHSYKERIRKNFERYGFDLERLEKDLDDYTLYIRLWWKKPDKGEPLYT